MPAYLRPCGEFSETAILTGDPARAMALAQSLTDQPAMANHARGLWGYHGQTASGNALNVQATGIGGPSALAVLADLADLGVKRAVRVGACVAVSPALAAGTIVVAEGTKGPGGAFAGNPGMTARLEPAAPRVVIGVTPDLPGMTPPEGVDAFDTQTAALFGAAGPVRIEVAAIVVVSEAADGTVLTDEELDGACVRAALAAEAVLGETDPPVES